MSTHQVLALARVRRRSRRSEFRNLPMAIAFILPACIGFGVFLVWPAIRGFWLSFTNYSVFQPGHFVGLANYREMIADPVFWASMRVTVYYVAVNIGVPTIVALLIAVLLNRLTQSMWVRARQTIGSTRSSSIDLTILGGVAGGSPGKTSASRRTRLFVDGVV